MNYIPIIRDTLTPTFQCECGNSFACLTPALSNIAHTVAIQALINLAQRIPPQEILRNFKSKTTIVYTIAGLFWPSMLIPMVVNFAKTGLSILKDPGSLPWIFARLSPARIRHSLSILTAANDHVNRNERIFLQNMTKHFKRQGWTDELKIMKDVLPKLSVENLQKIYDGNAALIANKSSRVVTQITAWNILDHLKAIPNKEFENYINEKARQEAAAQRGNELQRNENALAATDPDMLGWQGTRGETFRHLVGGLLNLTGLFVMMLPHLINSQKVQHQDKVQFAAQFFSDVADPLQACAEKAGNAFIMNVPLITWGASSVYWLGRWTVSCLPALTLLNEARQSAHKAQFSLAVAATLGMLPEFASEYSSYLIVLPIALIVCKAVRGKFQGLGFFSQLGKEASLGIQTFTEIFLKVLAIGRLSNSLLTSTSLAINILFKQGWDCTVLNHMPNPVVETTA